MFWKYNMITASHVETLLDKKDLTLKELMDEEDLLTECKSNNKKLLDFFVRPEIMDEMLTLITQEPDEQLEEKQRFKYPNIACELLSFDIEPINDALTCDDVHMNKLYNFLNNEKSLNPLLASFFSKTMGLLISKRTDAVFNFLKAKDFVPQLLKHMETSAIVDLLLRFINCTEDTEMRVTVTKWLDDNKLIERLAGLIDASYSEDFNSNASQALCDIVRVCREHMSMLQEKAETEPLLEALESPSLVSELLHYMLKDANNESGLVNGITVLLALLEFKKQGAPVTPQMLPNQSQPLCRVDGAPQLFISPFFRSSGPEQMTALDLERLTQSVNNVVLAITPRLVDFHNLLLTPPDKPAIVSMVSTTGPPLGICRLEIAHLVNALLSTNNHSINVKLASLGTVTVLVDLFFKYSWNNFLHTQVEQSVGRIIANDPTVDDEGNKVHPLLDQLLDQYQLTVKILEFWEKDGKTPGVHRKGYMGHLTRIANHIVQNMDTGVNSSLMKEIFKKFPEDHLQNWDTFISEKLAEINKVNTTDLVCSPPISTSLSDDNASGFSEAFESNIHQAFSDFQMQEITNNFVDQFGFHDNGFKDPDDGQLKRQVDIEGGMGSESLFEQICGKKVSRVDADDEWDDKQPSTSFSGRLGRSPSLEDNSSDSDEDSQVFAPENATLVLTNDEVKMDVDHQESWVANFDDVPMDVAPTALPNPWESSELSNSGSSEPSDWADFGNFASCEDSNAASGEAVNTVASVEMETSDKYRKIDTSATEPKSKQNEELQ